MKRTIFSITLILSFLILALPAVMLGQTPNLHVEGQTGGGSKLVRIQATSIVSDYDLVEIEAPSSPNSVGQFIECQHTGNIIKAQINWDGSAFFDNEINVGSQLLLDNSGTNSSAEIRLEDNSSNQTILIRAKDSGSNDGGDIILYGGSPLASTIEIDGNWGGTGVGRIVTDELQIDGGSDIAENFDVETDETNKEIQPGMIVSIDPNQPGKLQIAKEAYDSKVAGVISGANGVNTGLYMGQKGSEADGEHPVALAGRVYVKADAAFGKIRPGDLLTTSPTNGHAMKVKNHKKARGAVIGKAMSSLEGGKGYVLTLISLQ